MLFLSSEEYRIQKKRSCVGFLIWRDCDVIGWWKPWEADPLSPWLEVTTWRNTFCPQSKPVRNQWF